jgi:hypothetical protein
MTDGDRGAKSTEDEEDKRRSGYERPGLGPRGHKLPVGFGPVSVIGGPEMSRQ